MRSAFGLPWHYRLFAGLALALVLGCPGSRPSGEVDSRASGPIAPLLEGMGSHRFGLTTTSEEAEAFFNQGLVLAYGFNHAEAARSFRQAIALDPDCAMCQWGLSLVLGPNINAAMDPADHKVAYAAMVRATELGSHASAREQAYIAALGSRYEESWQEDRTRLDVAYAAAMRRLWEAYPDDPDAGVLYAEALMDTTPWDYWLASGDPKPETEEILAALEAVLEFDEDHPGAHHFYIHAVEAVHPERGIESAERLANLVPGAGHLVHMPSHIYIRVGRYREAVEANEAAIAADDAYVTTCHAQGLYPLAYMPHNRHFLWASATLAGQSETALRAAREMAQGIDRRTMREEGYGTLQHYWVTPLYALVRFGHWEEILAEAEPAAELVYPRGVWHYARAMALIRTGRLEEAATEIDRLEAIVADPALETVTVWDINGTRDLLAIAVELTRGELAAAHGRWNRAVAHLRRGVELEDGLNYDEPPPWHAPVRQYLGATLLRAGRPVEAEVVYRADLERFPDNGWSLFGLRQALTEQHRDAEAAAIAERWARAFEQADVVLTASRL